MQRIGQITPPWPAFLFAAHTDILNSEELPRVLQAIQKATTLFMEQRENKSVEHVKRILNYNDKDVRDWFKTVHYAEDHTHVSRKALQVALSTLVKAGVIDKSQISPEDLCHLKVAQLVEH